VSQHMRAQLFIDAIVLAFAEEVKIEFAENAISRMSGSCGLPGNYTFAV